MAILAWPSYPLPLPRRRRRGGGGGGGKFVPDLARAMRTVYAKNTGFDLQAIIRTPQQL